jgi:CheY-like chemotaxis protein
MDSGPRCPIIVVDDDAELRAVIEDLLHEEGFMVFLASSGDEVLELVSQGIRPCLLLCDVRMPGLPLADLLARLEENDRTRGVPVALMTGGSMQDLPEVAYVLPKPFGLPLLIEIANDAVARAAAARRASLAG